jgi:hypothetical protein
MQIHWRKITVLSRYRVWQRYAVLICRIIEQYDSPLISAPKLGQHPVPANYYG